MGIGIPFSQVDIERRVGVRYTFENELPLWEMRISYVGGSIRPVETFINSRMPFGGVLGMVGGVGWRLGVWGRREPPQEHAWCYY